MSQHDRTIANDTGAAVRADLNAMAAAEVTKDSGPGEPPTLYPNMWWSDTTDGVQKRRNNANDAWILERGLDTDQVRETAVGITVALSDCAKTVVLTNAATVDADFPLPAFADAGEGFQVEFVNLSNEFKGTLSPDGSEQIDGAASFDLAPRSKGAIRCNGTAWEVVRYDLDPIAFLAYMAPSPSYASGAFTKVDMDQLVDKSVLGAYDVGLFRWTPGVVGSFMFSNIVSMVDGVDQSRCLLMVYRNGVEAKRAQGRFSGASGIVVSSAVSVQATAITDYFEVFVFQDTGSARQFNGGEARNGWSAVRIG